MTIILYTIKYLYKLYTLSFNDFNNIFHKNHMLTDVTEFRYRQSVSDKKYLTFNTI